MLVVPVYKKDEEGDPANYRAVTLLSTPKKIFLKEILNKMRDRIEDKTKESKNGFRPGQGTADAAFIVRQIMKKAKERKIALHFNLIDFKATFFVIWSKVLWKILRSIGVVKIIEQLYGKNECAIIITGHITDWFEVKVGVCQGYLLSPTLFNIFLEFVRDKIYFIQDTLKLFPDMSTENGYADDTKLISAFFEKL